ncbi:ATP-binding protein [Thaumasiovibrio subtropicus]|uniref:sensor histidine kinase n=1 Tax=Thaumasiovibrio subtropicus TaxID=1891207 RepID=UPI000B359F7D|nr:ATP-binding protein [Thaumasiovibrio subtropicus]
MKQDPEAALSKKILILFLCTTSVLILQGIYNILSIDDVTESISQVHESVTRVNTNNQLIAKPVSELRQKTMNLVMAPNQETRETLKASIEEDLSLIDARLREAQQNYQDSDELNLLVGKLLSSWRKYSDTVIKSINYSDSGIRVAEFIHITTDSKVAYDEFIANIGAYNNHQVQISETIYIQAQESSKLAFWAVVITTVTEAIILKVILLYVLNIVKKYLDNKQKHADQLETKNEELQDSYNELKTMQGQLIESEKHASLSKLVAGVAHELSTPISVGLTTASHQEHISSELAEKSKVSEIESDEVDQFIQEHQESSKIMTANLKRADEIVTRFKRLSTDNVQSEISWFNLNDQLRDIVHTLSPNMRGIHVYIEAEEELEVKLDPSVVYHIISNLLMNAKNHAFEFTNQPKVIIGLALVEENRIQMSVKDNGKGISMENQAKIFDPFFTTNKKRGGTGLGLSIVYNTLSHVQGKIICDSEEGNGTLFITEIPCEANILPPKRASGR